MTNTLTKFLDITTEHFESAGKGYKYNGVTLGSIAEFYEIPEKSKKLLITLTLKFKEISQKLIKKEMSMADYLKDIENINNLAQEQPNINIGMNDKNEIVISIKSELKKQYQSQLSNDNTTKKETKPVIFALYGIEWEESERGWGTRPDGFTFHSSIEESERFLKEFIAKQPKEVPDEYSRPVSTAKLIEVSESLHDYVMENGSVWLNPNNEAAYKTYDASGLKKAKAKM